MAALSRTTFPHSSPTGSEVLDDPRDFTMHSERNFGPGGALDLGLLKRNSGNSAAAAEDISLRAGISCSPSNANSLRDCSPDGSPRGSAAGVDYSCSAQASLSPGHAQASLSPGHGDLGTSPPFSRSRSGEMVGGSLEASHPESVKPRSFHGPTLLSRFSDRSREAVSPVEVSPREAGSGLSG